MDCDLGQASARFQEMIDNKEDNLEYLKQLNETYKLSLEGNWLRVIGLILDMLIPLMGENVENFLGEEVSFDSLKKAVQVVGLVKPEAFGVALTNEVEQLEGFFKSELETIDLLGQYIDDIISKLNNEWSNLLQEDLQKAQRLELNQLMNEGVPNAGKKINNVKRELMMIESDVYNQNTTEQSTETSINELINELAAAKVDLNPNGGQNSIILNLLKIRDTWEDVTELFDKFKTPSSEEFTSRKDSFEEVGENFKSSIEKMLATLSLIRGSLIDLDNLDNMIEESWNQSVSPIIRNMEKYEGAEPLKIALDDFIISETPQNVNVDFPIISTIITSNTFKKWEGEANFQKLNKSTWINMIDDIMGQMDGIVSNGNETITSFENIYAPIKIDVIESYIEVSGPKWGELFRKFNESYTIIQKMTQGEEITKDILEGVNELQGVYSSLRNTISETVNYFETEDPKSALTAALDLGINAKNSVSGLILMADYLGLDFMSELLLKGNFGEVLNLDESHLDTTQQLINDLKCLEEANDVTKSIGLEIRKMITAEQLRKKRLQNDSIQIIEDSIGREEEEIKWMQNLNDAFANSI